MLSVLEGLLLLLVGWWARGRFQGLGRLRVQFSIETEDARRWEEARSGVVDVEPENMTRRRR